MSLKILLLKLLLYPLEQKNVNKSILNTHNLDQHDWHSQLFIQHFLHTTRRVHWLFFGVTGYCSFMPDCHVLISHKTLMAARSLQPVSLKCYHVSSLLANGSTAFIWKLCCHWLKCLTQLLEFVLVWVCPAGNWAGAFGKESYHGRVSLFIFFIES